MKTVNYIKLIAASAILALAASCQTTEPSQDTRTLTFEGASWNALIDNPQYGGPLLYGEDLGGGMYSGTDYAWYDQGNTELASELCENYGSRVYWNGGHAISNYVETDITKCDYTMHLAIPFAEGGHNGSNNFCVHNGFISEFSTVTGYFYFKDGISRIINHMYVAPTSYYMNEVTNGLTPAGSEDWTKIVATGYDLEGKALGTSEFYITENGTTISEWTKWTLSGLGEVYKVTFSIESSLVNEYGMAVPAYFAYDDVEVVM